MTKLLIASGRYREKNVQIINLDESNPNLICDNLPDLSAGAKFATGQLLGGTPIICGGGGNEGKCQAYQNGAWKFTSNSVESRTQGASAILTNSDGKDVLLIAGGYNTTHSPLRTVETFDGAVWNRQQEFPEPTISGCIVKLNSSTILHIGGGYYVGPQIMTNNYFYNLLSNKWTLGPPSKIGRYGLSCGILKWKNPESNQMEKVVVAAGGDGTNPSEDATTSFELLYLNDDNSIKSNWMMGPKLPIVLINSNMIEYNNSVILIGGYYNLRLLQLSSPKGPWIEMKQTLKKKIFGHVSFLVPDELVNCHN